MQTTISQTLSSFEYNRYFNKRRMVFVTVGAQGKVTKKFGAWEKLSDVSLRDKIEREVYNLKKFWRGN